MSWCSAMDSAQSYGHSYELLISPAATTSSIGELECDQKNPGVLTTTTQVQFE